MNFVEVRPAAETADNAPSPNLPKRQVFFDTKQTVVGDDEEQRRHYFHPHESDDTGDPAKMGSKLMLFGENVGRLFKDVSWFSGGQQTCAHFDVVCVGIAGRLLPVLAAGVHVPALDGGVSVHTRPTRRGEIQSALVLDGLRSAGVRRSVCE